MQLLTISNHIFIRFCIIDKKVSKLYPTIVSKATIAKYK